MDSDEDSEMSVLERFWRQSWLANNWIARRARAAIFGKCHCGRPRPCYFGD